MFNESNDVNDDLNETVHISQVKLVSSVTQDICFQHYRLHFASKKKVGQNKKGNALRIFKIQEVLDAILKISLDVDGNEITYKNFIYKRDERYSHALEEIKLLEENKYALIISTSDFQSENFFITDKENKNKQYIRFSNGQGAQRFCHVLLEIKDDKVFADVSIETQKGVSNHVLQKMLATLIDVIEENDFEPTLFTEVYRPDGTGKTLLEIDVKVKISAISDTTLLKRIKQGDFISIEIRDKWLQHTSEEVDSLEEIESNIVLRPKGVMDTEISLDNLANGLQKMAKKLTKGKGRKLDKEPTFHVKYLDGNHERISQIHLDSITNAMSEMIVKKTWMNKFQRAPILDSTEIDDVSYIDETLLKRLVEKLKYEPTNQTQT